MKAHEIENGVVVNTIEVKSLDWKSGLVDASLGGKVGDSWDGEEFTDTPAAALTLEESISEVIMLMQEKQNSSFLFGGKTISLNADSKAKINRIGMDPTAQRKVVPILGAGETFVADSSSQAALSNAASAYIQAVEDHAYDLIEDLKAGNSPDIEANWPR